jgi:hypothetical protein
MEQVKDMLNQMSKNIDSVSAKLNKIQTLQFFKNVIMDIQQKIDKNNFKENNNIPDKAYNELGIQTLQFLQILLVNKYYTRFSQIKPITASDLMMY